MPISASPRRSAAWTPGGPSASFTPHGQVGVAPTEALDELDDGVDRERREGDDLDTTGLEIAHRRDLLFRPLDVGQDAACGALEDTTVLGEGEPSAGAVEQGRVEAAFEGADACDNDGCEM